MPAVAGPEIERLIQLLARLPGLGPRSARRAALHLIKKREALMTPLTYLVVNKLKHAEQEDYFDTNTDFNPFKA